VPPVRRPLRTAAQPAHPGQARNTRQFRRTHCDDDEQQEDAMTVDAVTGAVVRRDAAVRYGQLPGPVRASCALPSAEAAVFTAVVPLLSIPVLLGTMAAMPAALASVVVTALVGALCLTRRTVVGHDWVADRRLWRYRVTHADALRAVEVVPNGHGGLLKLHPHGCPPHRLRATELQGRDVRAALRDVVRASDAEVSASARSALALPAPRLDAASSGAASLPGPVAPAAAPL
jgi:hypothetical protein